MLQNNRRVGMGEEREGEKSSLTKGEICEVHRESKTLIRLFVSCDVHASFLSTVSTAKGGKYNVG